MSRQTELGGAPLTPCIGVCYISPQTGLCAGCFRTRDEISRWPTLLPEQRRAVMAELAERQAGLFPPAD